MAAPILVQLDPFTAQPRMLTVVQVAAALNCTRAHIVNLILADRLAAFNFARDPAGRATYRIHPAALQRFLQECCNAGAKP